MDLENKRTNTMENKKLIKKLKKEQDKLNKKAVETTLFHH